MFAIGDREWPGLGKVAEEAAEVTQVIAKLIATRGEVKYYDGTDLKIRLEQEVGDLLAALEFIQKHCNLNTDRIDEQMNKKMDGFEQWHLAGLKNQPKPEEQEPEEEEEDNDE